MAESSARKKRSSNEGYLGVPSKKKLKAEPEVNKFLFRVLLPNGLNLTLELENADEKMSVAEFVRTVRRQAEKEPLEKGSRKIHWGPQVYVENAMGERIEDGKIICQDSRNKTMIIALQDGGINSVHTYQDMWNVTPEPQLLVELPQEYTFQTALADLIDNSLQAVWANGPGERRLISVNLLDGEVSIFDSGQGMDSSNENSIAKWGTMGSSNHRAVRGSAIGLKPPYLKPYFGMYGFGGLAASMHLGRLVMVSSKTKMSKKVVTLKLEKDTLVQKSKADRIWRTAGDIRDVSQEENAMSPHGSFTKVHISKLKPNYWNEDQLKCMLKDIYFPYIQNDDGFDESVRTSTPVEFEVNGTNLTEVAGGEVVATNLAACNGPPFVLELHLRKKHDLQGHGKSDANRNVAEDSANARITCFYFPILQGKESVDTILEKLEAEDYGVGESFETFCRVSIRRLGRLLPDARWGRLPFMEPKRKRVENVQVPQRCFKRVKCFVESDAGFAPTTSKTDLAHKHPFTLVLKNLGRKPDISDPAICMEIEREGRQITPVQLEKEYQDWLKAMHESFDEEVECGDGEATLILNPSNGKDLGISNKVIRVLTQIKRKGYLWKASQKIKILKGAADPRKDLYATLEYILCEGFDGDPGEARMVCRPMECPEVEGSKLLFNDVDGNASFELGSSRSLPLDLISSGKCQALDEDTWKRQAERKRLKAPAFIDVLRTDQVLRFDVDKGFPKGETVQAGFVLPKEIIAVVRPHAFKADNMNKSSDDLDQKSVVKDNMEMKMDIHVIPQDDTAQDTSPTGDVKFSMQTKACSRNGIHGLYSFRMEGSRLNEMFEKAGSYRFIFSMVNNQYANLMSTEADIFVEASEKVGKWKLGFQSRDTECTEIKQCNIRLGSEIGPLFISCYDVYSNRMAFKAYPHLEVNVHKMETRVNLKIEKASGFLTADRMYLQISKILFGGGKLDELRPSFEATLRVGSKDSCFAELPIAVLPGDMCSVKLSNAELDNCLRPGDVIHKLKLQVLDAYENPVEKGRKIKVELTGLEFQDQEFQDKDDPYRDYREVDDQGWVNFGGLLKVTGKYGSKGCIRVSSDTKTLLIKEFDLLSRELKVVAGIPEHSNAGSILKNVMFGIFDDEGNIDSKMNGCQHTLTVDLCTLSSVQYTFIQGKCTVPKLQLPEDIGLLEFKAFHSWHTELFVHIKVHVVPNPQLEIVSVPEQPLDDGAVCHAYDESTASQSQISNQIMLNEVKLYIEGFMSEMTIWEDDLRQLGTKVKKHEDELRKLEINKSEVNKSLSDLERELNKCTFSSKIDGKGMPNQSSHSVEDTLEEIKRQGTTAASLWLDLRRRNVQSTQIPIIQDVIGVVALLGKVEDDLLSRALSEYLGRENMLAVVCKSRVGAEALEHYDHSGNVITSIGLHGLASAQKAKINGRFRVICLEDTRSYEGGFKVGDPQKQLIIEDPKSSDGILPEGYMGYAVNMIKLDHEELFPSASSGNGLRGTLFFNLFSYLQVYKTRNHMKQAISYIRDGAVSLDGGMLRRKGVIECGNRDKVPVNFPTTSAKTSPFTSAKAMPSLSHLRLDIEEKIVKKKEEKEMLEKQIYRTRDKLERLKNKIEIKKKELEEREARKNVMLENFQQQGLLLENHEQSD